MLVEVKRRGLFKRTLINEKPTGCSHELSMRGLSSRLECYKKAADGLCPPLKSKTVVKKLKSMRVRAKITFIA